MGAAKDQPVVAALAKVFPKKVDLEERSHSSVDQMMGILKERSCFSVDQMMGTLKERSHSSVDQVTGIL